VTIPVAGEFMVGTKGRALAEFDRLAVPQAFPPAVFRPKANLDKRVLGLSLACNDLRDATWVARQADLGRRRDRRLDGYDAALEGLSLWAVRMTAGIIHETLLTLAKWPRADADYNAVYAAMPRVNPTFVESWDATMRMADAEKGDPDRAYLHTVRNKLAYHYGDVDKLAEGYDNAFLNRVVASPSTDFAWLSVGDRMFAQRFYYVDAAIQTAHGELSGDPDAPFERLQKLAALVAKGGAGFIGTFIAWRKGRLTAQPQSGQRRTR
jgi:hypothetical protein